MGQHNKLLILEGITPQGMLAKIQLIQHIQYNDTRVFILSHEYSYGSMPTSPYYYIISSYLPSGPIYYPSTTKWFYSMIMATLHSLSPWVPP